VQQSISKLCFYRKQEYGHSRITKAINIAVSASVITPVLPTCDPESNDIAVVAKSLISFVIDAFLVKDGIFVRGTC
jgi:hypothetical protein